MVRINLLPIREMLRKRELKQFLLLAGAILVSTVGLMIFTYLFFDWKMTSLEKDVRTHEAKLSQLKEKNKEIEELKSRITTLQRQVDTIQKLTETRDTPAPFMAAIALAIPDEVWLVSITKSGKSFALDGVGMDNTVVVNFVQRLQNIREGFTEKQPWLGPSTPNEKSFFTDVKLVQIVASTGTAGLGTMNFKIVGNVR